MRLLLYSLSVTIQNHIAIKLESTRAQCAKYDINGVPK